VTIVTERLRSNSRYTPRGADSAAVQAMLCERARLPVGHPDRGLLRARSIQAGLPIARCLATRYRGRGEPLDDLYQVATVALIKAVDCFDPIRQASFNSYAVPTILGALKRHFRDYGWPLRVPRRVQELAISLPPASAALAQRLGHTPTAGELAAHLGVTAQAVAVALDAWRARYPASLNLALPGDDGDPQSLVDIIGRPDERLDAVTDRCTLQPLLAKLSARQRHVLQLRFVAGMNQSQIAAELGLSQMYISRLLARTLTELRGHIDDEALTEPSDQPPR
jgi:RNA polymerase sigma-B factor